MKVNTDFSQFGNKIIKILGKNIIEDIHEKVKAPFS